MSFRSGTHDDIQPGAKSIVCAETPVVEYTPKENSAFVSQMFRGYSGHVRADAKSQFAREGLARIGRYEKVRDQRDLLRSALGYTVRQKDALMRVLDDGRLLLDSDRSERQLSCRAAP